MASGIPGAMNAIVNALRTNLPGVAVYLGPGNSDAPDRRYVLVGTQDPDDEGVTASVTGSQKWAQLGGLYRDEDFTVHCAAVSWNGDEDMAAAISDVYSMFDAIGNAIVSDPTLGRALLYAPGLTSLNLRLAQDANGAAALLLFDVECRTRI